MIIHILILTSLSITIFAQQNPITSLKYSLQNTAVNYIPCEDSYQCNFEPFPLEYKPQQHPHNPTILETFILRIPHGKVYSHDGVIIEKNHILKDLLWPTNALRRSELEKLDVQALPQAKKVIGKVAVIAQNGQFCYYHWMTEVLGRLLLLESHNIEYDYLVVPVSKSYMRESLELFGIDFNKIIEPDEEYNYIEADELIVPSLVNQVYPSPSLSSYPSLKVINVVRNRFLPKIETLPKNSWSKKIFISRKDAAFRKLINEDELFEKLKNEGFQRYCLSDLSLLEQIALFNHADIIIALHGAGLANLIFSKPETQVIELFQARADATYWYMSQTLHLHHTCIQTCEFDQKEKDVGFFDTTISQDAIDRILTIVQSLKDL